MRFGAILLLGGKSERFGTAIPKQFQELKGKKLYEHALKALTSFHLFEEIILVAPEGVNLPNSVTGGETRQLSSYKGLMALSKHTDYVLIHDGARPFLTHAILERHVEAVQKYQAVNTCIPSPDAINLVKDGKSFSIAKRGEALRGQTPQSFSYSLILEAHKKSKMKDAPCDCSLILEAGHPVHIVEGSEKNFKITSRQDLAFAEFLYPSLKLTVQS
ncbi:MAG: 2-C-methyl-D-erythritol 4-phosphate cytidylyltransferase [Verrucomicrobia bacterium]|nr:2-C-methyl-D-erythritol 4-phosphate cytidylyltransferase [Verrucomicrobiota bacterium]